MKREIKFRAWDKISNCWDDDFAIHADGCLYQPAKARWDISDIAIETAYDELEITQYTGLKDKNGVEIYEGDIYKCRKYSGTPGKWDRFIGKIEMVSASFRVVGVKQYYGACAELFPNDEVIGNIFENPELL